jgi:hypothetical protein
MTANQEDALILIIVKPPSSHAGFIIEITGGNTCYSRRFIV